VADLEAKLAEEAAARKDADKLLKDMRERYDVRLQSCPLTRCSPHTTSNACAASTGFDMLPMARGDTSPSDVTLVWYWLDAEGHKHPPGAPGASHPNE
jgi:hypothetical protein